MARKRNSNQIKTFTAKGSSAPGTLGSFAPAALGHFDPATGRVYQHPRLTNNPIAASGKVRVTNTAFSGPQGRERTRSVGMGGRGQTGRTIGIVGGSGD